MPFGSCHRLDLSGHGSTGSNYCCGHSAFCSAFVQCAAEWRPRVDFWNGFKETWVVVSKIFLFSPITWGRFPIWRAYFSNGWFNHQPENDDFLWIFPNVQGLTLILATSNGWWTPAGVGKTWYNCEVCSVLRYQYSLVTGEFLRQFYFYTIMIFFYLTVWIPRLESISWNWLVECVSGNPTT